MTCHRTKISVLLLTALCTGAGAVPLAAQAAPVRLEMRAQPLSTALREFARQTGIQIAIQSELTDGKTAPGLTGRYEPEAALAELLKGSGLVAYPVNENTYGIRPAGAEARKTTAVTQAGSGGQIALARADAGDTAQHGSSGDAGNVVDENEEMVVTGTNIRGARNSASPVLVFDREAIRQTGLSTTEQFVQTLPQNFGGQNSGTTIGGALAGEGGNQNYGISTGVNLRGLGNRATLVLVNGRRLAPAGIGNVVDVSMIPLAAVERVEVLTDGASAIYGSDAVGGVVNFILREDFEGAETQLRYGQVASGGHDLMQIGQIAGMQWNSGSGFVSYEYLDRSKLDSADRPNTILARDPTDLLPKENRHNVMASMMQSLSGGTRLVADGFYTQRHTERVTTSGVNPILTDARVKQFGSLLGVQMDFANRWQGAVSVSFDRNNTLYEPFTLGISQAFIDATSDVTALDFKADGTVFSLPAGAARLAVGGQGRRETYDSNGRSATTPGKLDRDIYSLFAELLVPLAPMLELSAAFRHEDYSDFGTTGDPKFGLRWAPSEHLSLRTTYGTSFRAPLLSEMFDRPFIDVYQFADPQSGTGQSFAIVLQGNNPGLQPEESTSWTAGVDFTDLLIEGSTLTLTYFDIDFDGRVGTPIPNGAFFSVLQNEAIFAPIITRNPALSVVNAYFADPMFYDEYGTTPGDIEAVIDNRITNVARRHERGLDFSLGYARESRLGQWSTGVSGTYLLGIENRITPNSPTTELVDTVFNPASLKLRANLQWSRGRLSAAAFINHTGGYMDTRPLVDASVDSWTTVDGSFTVRTGDNGSALLRNTTLSLSVQNVLDETPPRVVNSNGLNFDPTNASIVGRFLSLQLSRKW